MHANLLALARRVAGVRVRAVMQISSQPGSRWDMLALHNPYCNERAQWKDSLELLLQGLLFLLQAMPSSVLPSVC